MINRWVVFVVLVAGILGVDQLSKSYIANNIPIGSRITIVNGFFSIVHIKNPGIIFGSFKDHSSYLRLIIPFLGFILLGWFIWILIKDPIFFRRFLYALALICGGGLGNLLDRLRYGEVVDFLDFYWGRFHWPAFNIADSAITIGCIIIGINILRDMSSKTKGNPDAS